jgi:hypothetical protein
MGDWIVATQGKRMGLLTKTLWSEQQDKYNERNKTVTHADSLSGFEGPVVQANSQ